MNKKKFRKRIDKFVSKRIVQIIFFLMLIVVALIIRYIDKNFLAWTNYEKYPSNFVLLLSYIISYLADAVSVSTALGPLLVILKAIWTKFKKSVLEEETKTEANHHKIIRSYAKMNKDKTGIDSVGEDAHPVINITTFSNYLSKAGGDLMQIHSICNTNCKKIKPEAKNQYSSNYEKERLALELLKKGKDHGGYINIANVNVYTNLELNTKLEVVKDSNELFPLDNFIEINRMKLLGAHSEKNNNQTIRLNDLSYDENTHTLKLDTQRTTYFDMLITNRAMDYNLGETTLRRMFEFTPKLTPLKKSKFANHIGITGVIISKDGYVLIEKRDRSKSTWRDKFGPTISFSLKSSALVPNDGSLLNVDINQKIIDCIKNSLKENYSFIEKEDYEPLTFSKCFMGLARDLLEGGKPNMYFCVRLNKTAEEVTLNMQKYASLGEVIKGTYKVFNIKHDRNRDHELRYNYHYPYDTLSKDTDLKRSPLKNEKLSSKYYFIPFNDIAIDYYYQLNLPRGTIEVKRKFTPRFKKGNNPKKLYRTKKNICKECGEGLLACFSYLEIFQSLEERKVSENHE